LDYVGIFTVLMYPKANEMYLICLWVNLHSSFLNNATDLPM